jgi:hypothetical protein
MCKNEEEGVKRAIMWHCGHMEKNLGAIYVVIGSNFIWTAEDISPLGRLISWYEILCYGNYSSFLHWDCP